MTDARVALIYLDVDKNRNKQREFRRVADELEQRFGVAAHPAHTGQALLDISDQYESNSIDHLVIVCHGFSDRLLSARAGVHAVRHFPPNVVDLDTFTYAWWKVLAADCKISLCACMCSRSPSWWLRQKFRQLPGMWSPQCHSDGGQASFSARLRDRLARFGLRPTVRGHTTPAHVTHNPAGREHGPLAGVDGRSFFNQCLGDAGVELTWANCKKFNNIAKGALSERWILFDDTAVEEIKDRFLKVK